MPMSSMLSMWTRATRYILGEPSAIRRPNAIKQALETSRSPGPNRVRKLQGGATNAYELFDGARHNKAGVGFVPVLADVETFDFFFLRNANANRCFEHSPSQSSHHAYINGGSQDTDCLADQLIGATAIEQALPGIGRRQGSVPRRASVRQTNRRTAFRRHRSPGAPMWRRPDRRS